jgi:AcrR family transcriptional regulator
MDCQFQNRYSDGVTSTARRRGELTVKGKRTRDAIVAAAADLMFRNGVVNTTVEDIRDAAGVSSSQVYHYFSDKSALIHAVIAYQTDAVLGSQDPLFSQLDSIEGLRRWRDFLVDHQRHVRCRGGCPLASLGHELVEVDGRAREELATSFHRWESNIRSGLEKMRRRGELAPHADVKELALATLAAVQGGLVLTQIHRNIRPLATAVDAALALIESHLVVNRSS